MMIDTDLLLQAKQLPIKLKNTLNIPKNEDYLASNYPKIGTINYGTTWKLLNGIENYKKVIIDPNSENISVKASAGSFAAQMSLSLEIRTLEIKLIPLVKLINDNRLDDFRYSIVQLIETIIYKTLSKILFSLDENKSDITVSLADFCKYVLLKYNSLEFTHLIDKDFELNPDAESEIDFEISLQPAWKRAKLNDSNLTIFEFLGNFRKYLNESELAILINNG